MQPQNYQLPDEQPQPNDTTKAWFDSINAPVIPAATPAKQPPHVPWRSLGIGLASLLVMISVSIGLVSWLNRAPACLTNADYKAFLGVASEDPLTPSTNFYTHSIDFKPGTTTFADTSVATFLSNTGAFYKKFSGSNSIIITLNSDYIEGGSDKLAGQRLELLKNDLVQAGVDPTAIKSPAPIAVGVESDSPISDMPGMVSITSAKRCRT